MAPFNRRASLSSDFMLFSIVIFVAIILLSMGFWFQIYESELEKKRSQLPVEASRVNMVVSDSISYISQYAAYIGEKAAQHKEPDLDYIASLIGGKYIAQPQQHNFYYTTTFDWVTPDGMLRASNKIGVLQEPYDMSDRDYLKRTAANPWTLQMSKPRLGGLSGQWILPAGMGITDAEGKLLGSITLGFALGGLEKKIAEAKIAPDVHYLLLTADLQPVLNSNRANSSGPDPDFKLSEQNIAELTKNSYGYLNHPVKYNNVEYQYVEKVSQYPYLILTGYDNNLPKTLFSQIVLSRGIGLLAISLAAMAALLMLRRRFIKPIMDLSHKADLIRNGQEVTSSNSPIYELEVLDNELLQIADHLRNERRIKKELNEKTSQLEQKAKELEAANEEAVIARDAAVKANRAKSEFLANMSHELRTPMNAVIGLTDILLMKQAPGNQEKILPTMQVSADQLMQLINDLLDISKLENEDVKFEQIPFELEKIIADVVAINGVKANEKGIKLEIEGVAEGCMPLGDPHRLGQVLINLVGNAVKFTEKGSVKVLWECRESRTNPEKIDIKIDVQDTGIGIPAEQIENIFSKFVQADTSTTRKYGGTGLGLSISKTLVEKMNGELSVKSEYGKGACFTIKLSLPTSHVNAETADQPAQQADTRLHSGHVLLAEDNPANVLVATTLLDNAGYTWTLAKNGEEALEKFSEGGFDLVLMDIQMPYMDGIETTRRMREIEKREKRKQVPIIGITAHVMRSEREQGIEAGMNEYLSKPFNPNVFIDTIHAVCKSSNESQYNIN